MAPKVTAGEDGRRKGGIAKTKILDTAETLFSEFGYDGVPIRQIARDAGVELASVTYYFGKKEELLRQVVERRAPEMVEATRQSLDAAFASARNKPPTIEALIDALVKPAMERSYNYGPGWKNYVRLISSLATVNRQQGYKNPYPDLYAETTRRFIKDIRQALPGMSDESAYISYHFLNCACLHMMQGDHSIENISEGTIQWSDHDKVVKHLAGFFAAGFRYMTPPGD